MRLLLRLAFLFVCIIALGDVAHADQLANPDAPQSIAALWPMLAVGIANLAGVLIPRASADLTFFHTTAGKALLTGLGAFVSAIPSAIQAHGLCWAMLAWAALGCVGALTSSMSTKAVTAALLPLAFLLGLGTMGCHGYKAPTYATLALLDEGANAAAKATPPACETMENAAVDAAKSKDEATTKVASIHERCGAALTVLEGIGKGVKATRNSVHDAPDGALPPDALSWIALLAKQYCDAVPLLAFFHVSLPIPAGVC
jgi:hypothetical protein